MMSLGKVISQLSDQSITIGKKKKAFIPYRDSVLTWLLKESLGGNSKTAMIATISPAHHHTEETLSTLRYAKQARNIVNTARVNEDPKARIIRELKAEIERLRDQQGGMNGDTHLANLEEIASLRDQLLSKEREMDEIKRSWQERLKKAEERKMQEAKQLEKAGISFKVDNKLPNLVNLNEDPQLSDLLLYVIKEGQTRVGRMCPDSKHEIQLSGALIADDHCIINNVESVVNITPIGDAPTYVNGDMVLEPTILHHGDRVILGGDHYFRFNHPMEVKNKTSQASQEMKDFEYAKQELLNAQESRLQAELEEAREEARRQAEEEKLREIEKAKREAEIELNMQKTGYEGKLLELEQVLKTQLEEVQQAQQSRQEAEDAIQKLKKQKMMLEQEVIAGRKRQQLEANAAKKNETEGSADDEVFNDPEDNWEQDQKALSPFIKSPKSRHGPRRSFQSPINRSSVMSKGKMEVTLGDKILESCDRMKRVVTMVLDLCCNEDSVSSSLGELAIATDTCIKSIEQSTEDSTKVNSSSDVCMSFLNGCDVFIDKSLQGGIKSLEDWKSKAQSYISNTADKLNLGEIPVKVEFVVNSAIDLLSNCQELQVEVNSSMRESIDSLPSEYYSINYRRSQGLVNQVSDLVEKTGLLMQHTQPVLEGEDGDLRKISRCAEMIQKSAIQLLVSSNTDKNKSRTLSDSIDQSDCSVLSTVQMEQLEHAARELKTGAQSLIEQVDKVMSYDRQVSTPRGRRLLPASPDRAAASPISRGVTIKRL
ncbi:hypothetical protein KUTeg_022348 [Tegillarca granosa]|uniref:Kinesin motor domain-containing protein n=1 Tax=Tegillarca granosa TaxID=220873 RepID=A0ABQ9E5Z3_TEGGR|nr:hypothetical protein KUTeg_022348 [Tegillarca granosa]